MQCMRLPSVLQRRGGNALVSGSTRTAAPAPWHGSASSSRQVLAGAKSVKKAKPESEPTEASGEPGEEKPKKTRAPRKTAAKKAPAPAEGSDVAVPPATSAFSIPQRTMSIDSSHLPWGKPKPAGSAAAAIAVPKSRREEREKVVPMSQRFKTELEAMEARLKKYDAQGNLSYDRSILGEGKLHTYALAVYGGKESRFCEFMRFKLMEMDPVMDPETGKLVPRMVEFSSPTKTIKTFSEKSLKWNNKVIGYKQGGWVLMRAVLDEQLVQQVSSMIYFQYWRDAMNFTLAGSDDPIVVPRPCTPEQLADVEAWLLHSDEEADELIKCEEYGGEVDREIAAKVIRRDEMQEDLDVDETGRTIYKKDYTGTYVNPNNFYEGDEAAGFSAGAAPGRGRGGDASGTGSRSRAEPGFGQEDEGYQSRGRSAGWDDRGSQARGRSFGQERGGYQARGRPQQGSGFDWDEKPARSGGGGWREGGARDFDGPAVDKASSAWEQDDWGNADRQQRGAGGRSGRGFDGDAGVGWDDRGRGSSGRERDGGRQQSSAGGRFNEGGGYQGNGGAAAWGGYDRAASANEGGRGQGRGRGANDFYGPDDVAPFGQGWMAGGEELGLSDDWGTTWEQGAAQPRGHPADREGREDQARRGRGGRGGGRGRNPGGRPSYGRDQGY